MKHQQNAIEIVADAPITLRDFANCYPVIAYKTCAVLLSKLASRGLIRRVKFGLYGAA